MALAERHPGFWDDLPNAVRGLASPGQHGGH
jgi:hypothetical protein